MPSNDLVILRVTDEPRFRVAEMCAGNGSKRGEGFLKESRPGLHGSVLLLLPLLLDVTLLDLLHQILAAQQVQLQIGGNLARHDEKLIVNHLAPGDWAARRYQVRTPLKQEAHIPKDEGGEEGCGGCQCGTRIAEEPSETIESDAQPEDEQNCERDEKPVAVGRDSSPIGIAGNKEIECERGRQECLTDERFARAEKEEAGDGEQEDGSPGE